MNRFVRCIPAAFAVALFASWGCAKAQCPNVAVTLSPPVGALTTSAFQTGTIYSGTLTVTGSGCTSSFWLSASVGTNLQATPVAGLSVIRTGPAVESLVSGNCTYVGAGGNSGTDTSRLWNLISGVCSARIDVPVAFIKTVGNVNGIVASDRLLQSPHYSFGNATMAWGNSSSVGGFAVDTTNAPTLNVRSTACTLASASTTVTLPTVSTTSLQSVGATSGRTAFAITLSGCTALAPTYVANLTWSYAPGVAADVIANTANGPAANVGVQILDANFAPIANGATTALANVTGAGTFSGTFYAQYFASGPAGTGNVTGVATFTISYV